MAVHPKRHPPDVGARRHPANPAEALLQIEAEIRRLTARGVHRSQALQIVGVSWEQYRTARALAQATDRTKLRAMVEEWSFSTIRITLGLTSQPPAPLPVPHLSPPPGGLRPSPPWVPLVALLAVGLMFTI